jgi:cell division protein FtsZ
MPISLASENRKSGAVIKVIGVGGGGGNAVNNMINRGLNGVDFIVANTDSQALENNSSPVKIQLGKDTTSGLGAGADPNVGQASVEENLQEVQKSLSGADMVFVTAGMGGGTGTGGAPHIAKIAKDSGALVVGIVTKPFPFEGKKRNKVAEEWVTKLKQNVDALIVIPNARLLEIIDKKTSFSEAFAKVDEVLYNATKGISEIINKSGYINVDFADVKTVMKDMGDAIMGIGTASGDNRAIDATVMALNSPLLDGISIEGSKGVLLNITGGPDMSMMEISEAAELVEEKAGPNANIIQGIVYDDAMSDEVMVTIVATGFNKDEIQEEEEIAPKIEKKPISTLGMGLDIKRPFSKPSGQNTLKEMSVPAIHRQRESKSELGNLHQDRIKALARTSTETKKPLPKPTSGYHNTKDLNTEGGKVAFKASSNFDRPTFIRRMLD